MWYFVSQINLFCATHLPESLDSRVPQQSGEYEKEGEEVEKGDKRTRERRGLISWDSALTCHHGCVGLYGTLFSWAPSGL